MNAHALEAKRTVTPFRSSGPPTRFMGARSATASPIISMMPLVIRVGKNPGAIALTLMLYCAHSTASDRVKLMTPALLVLYASVGGRLVSPPPPRPRIDAMLMIRPRRRGTIERRPTSWQVRNSAVRLRWMTLCQPSSGWSSVVAPHVAPALFTRMSTGPSAATASSTIGAIAAVTDMSQTTATDSIPCPPRRATASSSSSRLRATSATRAPISPSASAICKPSPREPPVTSATLPVRSNSCRTPKCPLHACGCAASGDTLPTPDGHRAMDLHYTAEERTFRDEVNGWVQSHLPDDLRDKVVNYHHLSRDDLQRWHAILAQQGWIAPSWPREWGGTGWSVVQRYLFEELCGYAGAPPLVPFGLLMCAPVLLQFGTPAQKQRFLPPTYRC